MTDEPTNEDTPTEDDIKRFEEAKNRAQKHFYYLIGASITAWSSMEGYLVYVPTMLLGTTPQKAGVVLYSSSNFYSWLSIIRDLFNIDPSYQPLRSDWNKVEEKLKSLNDVRVRLAHHAVVESGITVGDTVAADTMDFFPSLQANKLDLRFKTQKQGALQVAELAKFTQDVGLVALIDRITPIYREQLKALVLEVARLQREAGKG
jgi:hypothetical protein